MPKYGRLFIYKKNSSNILAQYMRIDFIVKYDTKTYLTLELQVLYNILGIDARSLWEPKHPGQALWQELDKSDPTGTIFTTPTEEVEFDDVLQMEDGEPFELEDGDYLFLES